MMLTATKYEYFSVRTAAGIKWLHLELTIGDMTLGQIAKIYATMAKIGGRNSTPSIVDMVTVENITRLRW